MTVIFIRHLAIMFWGLFIFMRAVNQKTTAKIIALQVIYSIVLSLAIALIIRAFLPEVIVLLVFSFSCVFNKLISKLKWDIAITASVITCGISYVLNAVSLFLVSVIFGLIFVEAEAINDFRLVLFAICVFIVMGLFSFLLFRIRRLKNGFPFLHKKHISLLGAIITLIIFQSYTVIDIMNVREGAFNALMLFLLLSIAVCAVLIYIWWRTGITRTFKDTLVDRERDELNREIAEKDERIAEIEEDNAKLSRIIHNDRKRIEALRKVALALSSETSTEPAVNAQELLKEINRVDSERQSELNAYKKDSKPLPTTRITSLDITLEYMKQKSYENNIEFDVIVNGSIKHIIENLISEEQLRTITADLLENAIIATKSCDFRQILYTIGICDDCYEVRVEDSGIAFEEETLRDLGNKRTTTHANEGGTGIGMMEAFEIARATGASLIIEPLPESGRGFTKRVSLRFDEKIENQPSQKLS